MIKNKTILWVLFGIMVLAQLYVPYKMISDREHIIETGEVVRMPTRPVDPNDPFRGKFIRLSFADERIALDFSSNFESLKSIPKPTAIYAILKKDSLGYHRVTELIENRPLDGLYLTCTLSYVSSKYATLDFPFDRYYMEESKAKPAEDIYNNQNRNRSLIQNPNPAVAVLSILEGNAVLTDVEINGVSIKDVVKNQNQ